MKEFQSIFILLAGINVVFLYLLISEIADNYCNNLKRYGIQENVSILWISNPVNYIKLLKFTFSKENCDNQKIRYYKVVFNLSLLWLIVEFVLALNNTGT